jgi:tetratricopeptide (TPR) repeat protein
MTLYRRAIASARRTAPRRSLAMLYNNLGNALLTRAESTGSQHLVAEAVETTRTAAWSARRADPDRDMFLANHTRALLRRYHLTADAGELDEAVDTAREAVGATPADSPFLAYRLTELSGALRMRGERTRSIDDLDDAVRHARTATGAISADSAGAPATYHVASVSAHARFIVAGGAGHLDDAIEWARGFTQGISVSHRVRAPHFNQLGDALRSRFNLRGDHCDSTGAMTAWDAAGAALGSAPQERIYAYRQVAVAAMELKDHHRAQIAGAHAVRLLPLLVRRGLDRREREYQLRRAATSLASDAAACALAAGRTEAATTSVEHGRGVLWSQLLDVRTDLTALERVRPDLAARLTRCRQQLDAA